MDRLTAELETIERSAQAAHEAATHEESRSEDSHDTRSIEAGYLAGAQAARAAELKKLLVVFRDLPVREWGPADLISAGALVQAELDGKPGWFFLVGAGAAGMHIEMAGQKVQVVTVQSPLGEALVGRRAGESSEIESQKGSTEVDILGVH